MVRRLQQAGYDVGVISPADAHAVKFEQLGVRHISAVIDSAGLSPFRDLRLFARYVAILRRHRPVIFLSWTIKPNIYGSIASRLLGIPVLNNVSGLGTAFIREGPLTRLVSWLYWLAFSRSALVFFQNSVDRQLFVDRRLVSKRRTSLLPGSGIDTNLFVPSSRLDEKEGGSLVFLLVARLLRDKGVVEFAEAARLVRSSHPSTRFQMLGSLDADNRTAIGRVELQAWMDEGLIEYLGEVDDVRPHIAAADCVVLPSYREGMPRALLEGAALAKPLIATDVPGCTEIARDGVNAFVCTARDVRSLADAMVRMSNLPTSTRSAMGAAGRQIAVNEFAEHIVIDRYMAALTAALKSSDVAPNRHRLGDV